MPRATHESNALLTVNRGSSLYDYSVLGFDNKSMLFCFGLSVTLLLAQVVVGGVLVATRPSMKESKHQCLISYGDPHDHPGSDIVTGGTEMQGGNDELCCELCAETPGAVMWVFYTHSRRCYCKHKVGPAAPCKSSVPGSMSCISASIKARPPSDFGGPFMLALGALGLVYLIGGWAIKLRAGMRDIEVIPHGSCKSRPASYQRTACLHKPLSHSLRL
eukprot:COSAG01_NODE_9298_length_2490_cov_20.854036_2_plen_218_part_00